MFDVFYTGPRPNLFAFERPADSFEDAAAKSRTVGFWYINGNNDYTGFDFDWRPAPWDREFVHVFPSQWQNNGDVWFAYVDSFADKKIKFVTEQSVKRLPNLNKWIVPDNIDVSTFDFSWHPDPHEEPYEYHFPTQWHEHGGPVYKGTAGIKYVHRQRVRSVAPQIFYMDFLNPESKDNLEKLKTQWPNIKVIRYVDSHLNVFKRIANLAATGYVWIISSICDYSNFDFTWHPEQWKENMLHVFPSGNQKRGDTFFMNVDAFAQQMNSLELLDWYNVINYCNDQTVSRHPAETVFYDSDNLIDEIKRYKFLTPYAIFSNTENLPNLDTDVCLWREKDRAVLSYNAANSVALITRDVKTHLTTQLYDYPYINKSQVVASKASDVIFISNNEPMAEENWQNLLRICPRAKRSDGVTGRELAYKTAAQLSDTLWFYAVFAKTEVLDSFDFSFVPDYFQEPKHYIFHSRNTLNGLEYGAMNINLYNRQLVLDTKPGLDFTLSAAHEVVPICASISRFNTDPWITWRSAFREVLKLRLEVDQGAGVEIQHRLKVWCSRASGENAEYCLQGARDAVEYYEQVGGDYQALKLSFDWAWLEEFYYNKYGVRIWLEVA